MQTPIVRYANTSDGVRIAYTDSGDGVPIVVVTHLEGHQGLWYAVDGVNAVTAALGQRHRTITFDLRGGGLSDHDVPLLDTDSRLRDLESVVDAIGLDRFALAGVMLGGLGAIKYAALNPDRVTHLVLWNSFARIDDFIFRVPRNVALGELAQSDWEMFTEVTMAVLFGWGEEKGKDYGKYMRRSIEQPNYQRRYRDELHTDVTDLLQRIVCPTLVLFNEQQGHVTLEMARELATSIPDATFKVLPGWMLDDLDQVEASVDALLGVPAPRAEAAHSRAGFSTILFTDVVSSTPLLSQLRDERMRAVMRDHDAVCEAAITEHGGRVVKTIGDAFMAEFSLPSAAIEAALAIQRGIREQFAESDVPVRLRIGINAGEPIVEDDDLHGASVVIAKRLESEADSGGILVSDVVRQAVAGKDFEFEDRGEVELKGFDQPVRAWAVRWEA